MKLHHSTYLSLARKQIVLKQFIIICHLVYMKFHYIVLYHKYKNFVHFLTMVTYGIVTFYFATEN